MRYAIAVLLALLMASESFAHVRTVKLRRDELLTVRTALGIATIVQTPDAIQSAVIGDQSGFKVEYLDKAVTIKPLRYGAKTNLYLMTEKERFNVRLQTLSQDSADYVVYIAGRDRKKSIAWRQLSKTVSSDVVTMKLSRIALSDDEVLLIDGSLAFKRETKLKPDQFWVLQGSESKVINSLFLTSLDGRPNGPIRIAISISTKSLDSRKPVTIQFRQAKNLSLSIVGSEWKG